MIGLRYFETVHLKPLKERKYVIMLSRYDRLLKDSVDELNLLCELYEDELKGNGLNVFKILDGGYSTLKTGRRFKGINGDILYVKIEVHDITINGVKRLSMHVNKL